MAFGFGFGMPRSFATPFSPASLFATGAPGAWYDPSDRTTLFQDSVGTTPVTAVEQPVGLMLDKSGRGNHAFQATSASRPVLKVDGNGKYYLKFDGVDDSLSTNSINFTSTDKMSVFAGVRDLSTAVASIVELSAVSNSNNGTFVLYGRASTNGDNAFGMNTGSTYGYRQTAAPAIFPDTEVISIALAGNGNISTGITPRINATAPSLTNFGAIGTGNFGNYPLYIGRRGGTSLPFNGQLYSMIIVGKAVTAGELSSSETYVNQKTGAY